MLDSLLRPFAYLTIEHDQKRMVDWLYPSVLALISLMLLLVLRWIGEVDIFSSSGFISKVLGFVQSLPGFYIAALAAIATFNKNDIDQKMPNPAPTIGIKYQGKDVDIELTRRRFLCLMFAFLTAESFLLILVAIFSVSIAGSVKTLLPVEFHYVSVAVFLFLFLFILWQMVVTSFWGLFYLGDRLHQPD
jgi:hypothetical protein